MTITTPSPIAEQMPWRASTWLILATGAWLVGLGLYFVAVRPPLLPEDLRFMAATEAQLRVAAPSFESWLHKVLLVMGGFMVSAGVLIIHIAAGAMRRRLPATTWAIALAGVASVSLMSIVNFELHSEFRWVLLLPALVWLIGLIAYIAGW